MASRRQRSRKALVSLPKMESPQTHKLDLMTAIIVLAAVHLAVLGLWFLPRSVWEKVQAVGDRPVVMFRAVPMALAATWISFGIVGPLVDAEIGPHPAKPWDAVAVLIILSPYLLVFTTMLFAWPLIMIPPGARTSGAEGEARWFDRHPLPGLAIIGLVLVVGIAIGRLRDP
jgi:hypothetical protein